MSEVESGAASGPPSREARLRRLKIRVWRRGTKEMDLILGGFFDRRGAELSEPEIAALEALLEEDDTALYRWTSGGDAPPERHAAIINAIRAEIGG